MPTESNANGFGKEDALKLLKAGWTQGSVFRPNQHIPAPPSLNTEDIYFVVCTQACSLVSASLEKDPFVEIAVARPVANYAPKASPAAGKEVRKFHLPVADAAFKALEVDINSRFTTRRELLLQFDPDGPTASEAACRNLAGWLGRYYTRIALPDQLVARLKEPLFALIEKFLKAAPPPGGTRHHDAVHSIYVQWNPSAELGPGEIYQIDLLILCDDAEVADHLGGRLGEFGLDPDARVERGGISVQCNIQSRAETLLTDIDGWVRLTEWDYLTGLGEASDLPG